MFSAPTREWNECLGDKKNVFQLDFDVVCFETNNNNYFYSVHTHFVHHRRASKSASIVYMSCILTWQGMGQTSIFCIVNIHDDNWELSHICCWFVTESQKYIYAYQSSALTHFPNSALISLLSNFSNFHSQSSSGNLIRVHIFQIENKIFVRKTWEKWLHLVFDPTEELLDCRNSTPSQALRMKWCCQLANFFLFKKILFTS